MKKLLDYAQENNVPIIEKQGLDCLLNIIRCEKPNYILEIGSAIGYSAINMALNCDAEIYTIERDDLMYEQCIKNIERFKLNSRITAYHYDALEFDESTLMNFDIIYIDAAKAQYKKFFEKYVKLLNKDGIVIFDNLNFHGYVELEQSEIKNRNLRQLVRKIKEFNKYVKDIEGFNFEQIDEGDGLGILRRVEDELHTNIT